MGAVHQQANVMPPRRGAVIALDVDDTARPYDLSELDLAGEKASTNRQCHVFVSLQAVDADVWIYFASETHADLDDTAAIGVAGAIAYDDAHGWRIPKDDVLTVRIDRQRDRWMIVKCKAAAAATLLLAATSEPF